MLKFKKEHRDLCIRGEFHMHDFENEEVESRISKDSGVY